MRRAKLTRCRQQAVTHCHQLLKIGDAVAVCAFKPKSQIHQSKTIQPKVAAKGHVVF